MNEARGATNLAIKYGNETPAMHHALNLKKQLKGRGKREQRQGRGWRGVPIWAPAKSVVCLYIPMHCTPSFVSCLIFHLHFWLCCVFMFVARCIFRVFLSIHLTFDMHTISSNFIHSHSAQVNTHTHPILLIRNIYGCLAWNFCIVCVSCLSLSLGLWLI